MVGLRKLKNDAISNEEPAKKRREFLDRLEDCAVEEEDELDCYLKSVFAPHQTK